MLRGKSLAKEILFLTASGTLLVSSLFAPNAAKLLKPLLRWRNNWDKIDRRRIQEAVSRLNKKRLVSLREKEGNIYLDITKNGNKLLKRFDYDDLELSRGKQWNEKWHLVIFDIPDKKKKERNAFSKKLKDLGFYPIQESVFVYPYDCQDEVDFISEFLSISMFVNYCVIEAIDKREGDLRKRFNLKIS